METLCGGHIPLTCASITILHSQRFKLNFVIIIKMLLASQETPKYFERPINDQNQLYGCGWRNIHILKGINNESAPKAFID